MLAQEHQRRFERSSCRASGKQYLTNYCRPYLVDQSRVPCWSTWLVPCLSTKAGSMLVNLAGSMLVNQSWFHAGQLNLAGSMLVNQSWFHAGQPGWFHAGQPGWFHAGEYNLCFMFGTSTPWGKRLTLACLV